MASKRNSEILLKRFIWMNDLKTRGYMLENIVQICTNFLYLDQGTLLFRGVIELFMQPKKKKCNHQYSDKV
jgi:hypothetical protein